MNYILVDLVVQDTLVRDDKNIYLYSIFYWFADLIQIKSIILIENQDFFIWLIFSACVLDSRWENIKRSIYLAEIRGIQNA